MSCDNGGMSVGYDGKLEYQYKIGNRLVMLDISTAKKLKEQERNGTLDEWWYKNDKE